MVDLNATRERYSELIRQKANLRSDRLIRALSLVRREDYLGEGPWKIQKVFGSHQYQITPDDNPVHLYDDVVVALDAEHLINNGVPSGNAKWIDALDLRDGDNVMHAGCGTGYYTAIIAYIVGSAGRVTAVEYNPALAARAQRSLRSCSNVRVITGDATTYNPGMVDAIMVNAGATHPCSSWLDSLKPGGRLVFPLVRWPTGSEFGSGIGGWGLMVRIERAQSSYRAELLSAVGIFPCLGAVDAEADRLLAEALSRGGLGGLQSLRRERHDSEPSCLLHADGYCFSKCVC